MSYSIFYRAMFIKMKDGTYIPTIESGDNNVWDCDNRRRSREWCSHRWNYETEEQKARFSLTEEEIISSAQAFVDQKVKEYDGREPAFGGEPHTKEQVLKDFYYFSCVKISGASEQTAALFLNFFKSGFRNAITMDELDGGLSLFWYDNTNGGHHEYVQNEEELAEKWDRLRARGITPWVCLTDGSAQRAWREVKDRNRMNRVKREHTECFIVALKENGVDKYLFRLTGRHLWFTRWADSAHKYATRKGAEHAAKRVVGRFVGVTEANVVSLGVNQ
jgi:hypothetical protein